MKYEFDVIILGGGAAGLFCAIEAGKRARRVAVLERAGRIGKKILISGGGRCNFGNSGEEYRIRLVDIVLHLLGGRFTSTIGLTAQGRVTDFITEIRCKSRH